MNTPSPWRRLRLFIVVLLMMGIASVAHATTVCATKAGLYPAYSTISCGLYEDLFTAGSLSDCYQSETWFGAGPMITCGSLLQAFFTDSLEDCASESRLFPVGSMVTCETKPNLFPAQGMQACLRVDLFTPTILTDCWRTDPLFPAKTLVTCYGPLLLDLCGPDCSNDCLINACELLDSLRNGHTTPNDLFEFARVWKSMNKQTE